MTRNDDTMYRAKSDACHKVFREGKHPSKIELALILINMQEEGNHYEESEWNEYQISSTEIDEAYGLIEQWLKDGYQKYVDLEKVS